jgi:hypothetical protein
VENMFKSIMIGESFGRRRLGEQFAVETGDGKGMKE